MTTNYDQSPTGRTVRPGLARPFVSRNQPDIAAAPEPLGGARLRPYRSKTMDAAPSAMPTLQREAEGARLGWAVLDEGVGAAQAADVPADSAPADTTPAMESGWATIEDTALSSANGHEAGSGLAAPSEVASVDGPPLLADLELPEDFDLPVVSPAPAAAVDSTTVSASAFDSVSPAAPDLEQGNVPTPEEAAIADTLERIAQSVRAGRVEDLLTANPRDTLTALIVGYVTATRGVRPGDRR